MPEKIPRPAECEEFDEDAGREVLGTRQSASTSTSTSRHHERPKSSRDKKPSSRSKKAQIDLTPPPSPRATRPPSSKPARKVEVVEDRSRKDKESRRKSVNEGTHKRSSSRQPASREKERAPRKGEDPTYYGVKPQTSPTKMIPIRPRALTTQTYAGGRPISYNGSAYSDNPRAAPPLSSSAYFSHHMPSLSFGGRSHASPSPSAQQFAVNQPQPIDYFASQFGRSLAERFDPVIRTSSAYGMRDAPVRPSVPESYSNYEEEGYASAAEGAIMRSRRASIREPTRPSSLKVEEEKARMPPPPSRPAIRHRAVTEYSQGQSPVGTRHYAETHEYHEEAVRRDPKRSSASYDLGRNTQEYRVETANNGRRRQSYYGQSTSTGSSGTGYEDKFNSAKAYQQDVAGEPVALTAELLKKQRRQAGSNRSTKSSDSRSRDESEYRRSATTRTTRSGSDANNENLTIKVTGSANLVIGDARLELGRDGGEIQIKRQSSIRNGSEKSNSEYGGGIGGGVGPRRIDERKGRLESRPSGRSRMSSTNGSDGYPRTRPGYPVSSQYYDDDDDSNYF